MVVQRQIADGLTPRKEQAIVALLSEHNIHKAAERIGVAEKTIYRWLEEPAFSSAYRKARREAFGQAIALMQRYAPLAVNTLAQVLMSKDSSDSSKVQAATTILKMGREGIELDDLAGRVEALELAAAQERQGSDRWG